MRILEISVRSDIGGGPKHLLDLVNEIKDSHYIDIAAPKSGDYTNDLKEASRKFIDIPFRAFSVVSFFVLLNHCRLEKVDLIHSHGRGAGFYSRLLKLFGFKVVHTFHGVHLERGWKGKLKLLIDKVLVPLTDAFICVSESEKILAIKHGVTKESKTHVVLNGVYIPNGVNEKKRSKEFVLGTLSRLNYQKGLDILIKYVSRFESEENIKLKCLIGGSGELEAELKSQNKSQCIEFLGNVEPISFLSKLDVYISFARWEGLPLAVIEAMSYAKPCLISNVEGNKDLVQDTENGFLFELDSYEEFACKLKSYISSGEQLSQYGNAARKRVIEGFSVNRMAIETLDIYKKIIS